MARTRGERDSSTDDGDAPGKSKTDARKTNKASKQAHPPKQVPESSKGRSTSRGRQGKRGGGGSSPSDSSSSSSSEDEDAHAHARTEARKKHRKSTKGKENSETTLRNIKTLRGMLPLYTKATKTRIENHIAMYVNLMEALEFDTDKQMVRYLSWTFGTDCQAFFLSRNVREFPRWNEYKREVIKHFSPRRNKQEALQYALGLTCAEGQNPREFLQDLKHAFAQAHETVEIEGTEFRNTFFFGLPPMMRTQMARDFNRRRSVRWILQQAVNIFEVSGVPNSTVARDVAQKAKAIVPSKVMEISKTPDTALEAGKAQGNQADRNKGKKAPPKQKEVSVGGTSSNPAQSPTIEPKSFYVSAKYKGTRPQENYVYQPKNPMPNGNNNKSDDNTSPRWEDTRDSQEGGQDRRTPSREQYEGTSDQRSYSANNSFRPYQPRERSPERYRRAPPDQTKIENLEQQMREMQETMARMSSSGRSSRPATPSATQEHNQE